MTRRASSFVAEIVLAIDRATAPAYVQAVVREFVRAHGTARDEWNLAIAASEAATNIAKFATSGTLTVRVLGEAQRVFELVAEDDGPGLDDPERALRDHVSEGVDLRAADPPRSRRGLGTGLGAIARAMNASLTIERRPGGGTRLVGRRSIKG